jgi:hypothetical protein
MPATPKSLNFHCGHLSTSFPHFFQSLSCALTQENVFPSVRPIFVVVAFFELDFFDSSTVRIKNDFTIIDCLFVLSI